MAAVAVVAPLPVIRAPETWQYGDPSLADLRLSLLDRGQSDGVTRRKRTGSSRNRHSWRWSWKQMLTKPFQNQTWIRGGNLREKGNRKKRKSESQNVSKNSVETRKKMDELYRIWLCDVDESSDESSDEELSERDRRRSCYARVFDSDTSSSDSDTDAEEEHLVSQYVREGPSRIKVDTTREEERISEDIVGISDTSSQTSGTSDSSSEIDLIQTSKQGTINQVVDLNQPDTNGYQNILTQNETVKKHEVIEIERDNYDPLSPAVSMATESLREWDVVEIKRNTVNSEPQLTIVSHPITKTAQIKAIAIPEPRNSTNHEPQSNSKCSDEIADLSNTGAQLTEQNENDVYKSDVSHDYLTQEANNERSGEQTDRVNLGVMTSTRSMINNYVNGRVISVRQIHHQDILKRVDELCAQCGEEVYGETKFESYGMENCGIYHDNTMKITIQESGMKNFDGNLYDLDSPQERKESSDKVMNISYRYIPS